VVMKNQVPEDRWNDKKSERRMNLFKRSLLVILLVCISVSALSACNTGSTGNRGEITVIDGLGNEVVLKGKPERIVSLTLASDEILLDIADKKNIRALSTMADVEGMSNIADRVEEFDKLPTNAEQVIAAQPDIVICSEFSDSALISQLRDAGIPVYIMTVPTSMEEYKETIKSLAAAIGEEKRGNELVRWMEDWLNAVKAKVETLNESEKVRVLTIDSMHATYGMGSTFDAIATHAGVINLAAEAGIGEWAEISKEQVVGMNPDIIILPTWSYEGFDAQKFLEEFKNDKSLETVNAIKNDRVYALPEKHRTCLSQYIVLGVEDLAKAAYPELFKEE
jgi:iron complex transport system substrate-binding protein